MQQRQHSVRKRFRRRELFLRMVACEGSLEDFTPEEAVQLLVNDLRTLKTTVKSAARRKLFGETEDNVTATGSATIPPPKRPVHLISRLNSSPVYPPLVPKQVAVPQVALNQIITFLRTKAKAGTAPHQLLDLLATASGMSWPTCAELLLAYKIIGYPIGPSDIEATLYARQFWVAYALGRSRYRTLVQAKQVPLYQGDWAFFDRRQLALLLPNLILADHYHREEFLVNYVTVGDYSSADVYSMPSSLPLFQHRFLPRFSPLIFGRPRLRLGRRESSERNP